MAEMFDVDAWFARLDELGGRDFLPEGLPEDPPSEPDDSQEFSGVPDLQVTDSAK